MVLEISHKLKGASFAVLDTDEKTFKKVRGQVKPILFGQAIVHGIGTGMNPELAQKAALADKARLVKLVAGYDLVILIGALGGGVASGAGPVLGEIIKEQKIISLGIFTLPFEFEGEKKMRLAKKAALQLREHLSGTIVVANEKIFQLTDKKMPLKKALSSLDLIFAGLLSDIIGIILKPSLINIDFADLRSILKDRNHDVFLSKGEAAGPNRVEDVLKQLFSNPIFEGAPKKVSRILFNISGGNDLKLKEVEQVSSSIAALNPRAKIIFGISECLKSAGKLKIILLAVAESEEKEEKPKKKRNQKFKKGNGANKANDKKRNSEPKEKQRRNALEVKTAKIEEEQQEWEEGATWEIPAFLRKK